MDWADDRDVGYLIWAWWLLPGRSCTSLAVIRDVKGTPRKPNGTALKAHLAKLVPRVSLDVERAQALDGAIELGVRCRARCWVSPSGRVRAGRRTFRLTGRPRLLAAGRTGTFELAVPRAARSGPRPPRRASPCSRATGRTPRAGARRSSSSGDHADRPRPARPPDRPGPAERRARDAGAGRGGLRGRRDGLPGGRLQGARRRVREELAELRSLTQRPFGLNVFAPPGAPAEPGALERYARALGAEAERYGVEPGEPRHDDDGFEEKLALAAAERVPVLSFTFGCPPLETDRLAARRGRRGVAHRDHARGGAGGGAGRRRRARGAGCRGGRAPRVLRRLAAGRPGAAGAAAARRRGGRPAAGGRGWDRDGPRGGGRAGRGRSGGRARDRVHAHAGGGYVGGAARGAAARRPRRR